MADRPLCSIPNCPHLVAIVSRGWCNMHYLRWKRTGDPLKVRERPKGAGNISADGYLRIVRNGVSKREHVRIAELALGHELPAGAVVHHHNQVRIDNRNRNLVVCQDETYHRLLHVRTVALKACGNPNWRRCYYCKQHDDPINLRVRTDGGGAYHLSCSREISKEKYHGHISHYA